MANIIEYEFYPDDEVWVLNRDEFSVNSGICTQVDIKIYKDEDDNYEHLIYWVLLDDAKGSIKVSEDDIFATSIEALEALGELLED